MTNKKIGLQTKCILVLSAVVLAASSVGGWLYYAVTKAILQQSDRHHAEGLTSSLALAAQAGLVGGNRESLQRMVSELLSHPHVHYACILDTHGKELVRAERVDRRGYKCRPIQQPPSMSYEVRRSRDFLEIGRPVLITGGRKTGDLVAGAVRLVLDTSETAGILRGLQREVAFIGVLIVLCLMPLGYLLAWRVLVLPIDRLVEATRQLARGDFAVRVQTDRSDEIGELAGSFDAMAESLYASQLQLRQANESLERKVTQRTRELERTNHRLREEMAEKEDFLRAVSHDLNAPLRNIAGMATMISLKWGEQLPAEVSARLERIQANVKADTDLLGELLELSRIKTRPETREMVDFGALLEDIRGSFEYELNTKRIEMTIGRPMPTLYVERNRMRQVFQNLVDNAIKYMGDRVDGRIEVHYESNDGMHLFRVVDNGPGIAPEDHERIFYVFRRAASAESANVPGKGVGLALVKTVASNYEGRVWVSSKPQEGSVFHVALSARCTEGPGAKNNDILTTKAECVAVAGSPGGG